MSTSLRTLCVFICVGLFVLATSLNGVMAYEWSFTDTTFGGYLGVAIPMVLCLCCFLMGIAFSGFNQD